MRDHSRNTVPADDRPKSHSQEGVSRLERNLGTTQGIAWHTSGHFVWKRLVQPVSHKSGQSSHWSRHQARARLWRNFTLRFEVHVLEQQVADLSLAKRQDQGARPIHCCRFAAESLLPEDGPQGLQAQGGATRATQSRVRRRKQHWRESRSSASANQLQAEVRQRPL